MVAAPAAAQTTLGSSFGAANADGGGRNKLNVQLSVAEALDNAVPPELRSLTNDDLRSGGYSSVFAASADYARNHRSVQVFGAASAYGKYVHRFERVAAGSQVVHAGAGVRLPKQGSLTVTQAAAHSPSYLYELFPTAIPLAPGEALPVNPEYRITDTDSYSYNTRMALAFGPLLGTRVTATTEYGFTDFKNDGAVGQNLERRSAGLTMSRAISRRAAFSVGYGFSTGEFSSVGTTKTHRMTIGVQYSPPLSVTRRVTFRLAMSPSMFEIPVSTLTAITPEPPKRVYPWHGEASVDYPFRLKWRASASYRRSVDYVAVFTEPVFTSGASVTLAGTIGNRVGISTWAGYASAESAISRNSRNLNTYTGEGKITYALTRSFALYSQYSYYYYDLRGRAHLAAGLPGVYEQQGIRVGFIVFSELLGN